MSASSSKPAILVRQLGRTDYTQTWLAMQQFNTDRTPSTTDEVWVTEHFPVYTLGLNRQDVRLPEATDIPLVMTDRGGKITYHGPGQLILYPLLDLKRHGLSVRKLVSVLENSVIAWLAEYGVQAQAKSNAPGVYVQEAKIAALGLRIKNNGSYHGLSVNVAMDLSPFSAIDPCGYAGLAVTQTQDLGLQLTLSQAAEQLTAKLVKQLEHGIAHD
ncbi:MAG: lipoyl-protein ligase [Pseudomonadota bacterium]|jgi:lipoyl(octanoyl) transferase